MPPLVEEAMRAVESGDPTVTNEGFPTLAEIVAVNRIKNFHSDIIPEANKEILKWASLEQIQSFVQRWIEAYPDHPSVASAFWVLGKFQDKALRPFLRACLERYVRVIESNRISLQSARSWLISMPWVKRVFPTVRFPQANTART
jgi:hypothetical protein